MTTATVWGIVGRIGDISEHRDRYGRIVDAHCFDSLDLELGGTRIDLDHDPKLTVGEVIYAEITDQERIAVVGVIDGLDLDKIDQPVFMSGEFEMRGDVHKTVYRAREAQLLSIGLTLSPATHAAQPIGWRAGDVRSKLDRFSWPISWGYTTPLLQRCHDWRQGLREHSAPERIVDLRDRDDNPWRLREGDRAPSHWRTREFPNGLRKSAHRGRILRVY